MLSIAMRLAQRMGLADEAMNAKCLALEAEMRRRLWWSLLLFDTRICEMSDSRATTLNPLWGCNTLLNASDFDLQPMSKEPPAVQQNTASESLFVVVRSEIADFLRHSTFHLDFVNPALKAVAEEVRPNRTYGRDDLLALEKTIEHKYFRYCLLYTSPSPRDGLLSRMPSSA